MEWINVEDKLPKPDTDVVCLINAEFPRIGGYKSCLQAITYMGGDRSGTVTHWMSLPPLPTHKD